MRKVNDPIPAFALNGGSVFRRLHPDSQLLGSGNVAAYLWQFNFTFCLSLQSSWHLDDLVPDRKCALYEEFLTYHFMMYIWDAIQNTLWWKTFSLQTCVSYKTFLEPSGKPYGKFATCILFHKFISYLLEGFCISFYDVRLGT